ncbi:MAG: phosphatase PAP2 family protein [Candidatus Acidiferrales bacterium]
MSVKKAQKFGSVAIASTWQGAGRANEGDVFLSDAESVVGRALKRIHAEATVAWAGTGAYERVALTYLGASSALIAYFAKNLQHPLRLLGVQAGAALVVMLLCWVGARAAAKEARFGKSFATQWWHFWRHWYPHLFFLFCFEELGHLMTLFTPEWQDAKLLAFDRWLTGVQPTIWLEQFATPLRNDGMQFFYLTYFTYLLILGGILYYRREWQAYWAVMTYSMVGYMCGYLIAMFFPIESPWFALAGSWKAPLAGGPFTATINFIEHFGRVRGAAFPSEHVAGAMAAVWGAWKFRRWLFWVMVPFFLLMCVSTIWGRYHYVADIFGGMTTGTLGYVIGDRIMKWKGAVATLSRSD